jgi:hypothetical protein
MRGQVAKFQVPHSGPVHVTGDAMTKIIKSILESEQTSDCLELHCKFIGIDATKIPEDLSEDRLAILFGLN